MEIAYKSAVLSYTGERLTVTRRDGRVLRDEAVQDQPKHIRRMLRDRRLRIAAGLALLEDWTLPIGSPPTIYGTCDRTFAGCRDRLLKTAIVWNQWLRPLWCPTVESVDMPEAFGGQGALTRFRDLDLTIYFVKGLGSCRLRIEKHGEEETRNEVPVPPRRDSPFTQSQPSQGRTGVESLGRGAARPFEVALEKLKALRSQPDSPPGEFLDGLEAKLRQGEEAAQRVGPKLDQALEHLRDVTEQAKRHAAIDEEPTD